MGFPYFGDTGEVVVYEKNNFGFYEKIDEPFIHNDVSDDSFGRWVDIEGDLRCVYLVWHTFISSNKWEGFYSTDAFYETGQCFIAGDMSMVKGLDWTKMECLQFFKHDSDLDGVVFLQESIPVKVVSMGCHHCLSIDVSCRDMLFC